LFEGREGEVWQVAAQLCIAGCLFELAICFTGVILQVRGEGKRKTHGTNNNDNILFLHIEAHLLQSA